MKQRILSFLERLNNAYNHSCESRKPVKNLIANHMTRLSKNLSRFSAHLFWDINPKDMDAEKHKQFIVQRVLQYGLMSDWILLRESLEIKEIADIAAGIKDLDPKSCSFISLLANKPKEEFLCYSTKQSIPAHWNF